MKSRTYLFAAAVLVAFLASRSDAQTQNGSSASSDVKATTPAAAAQGVTSGTRGGASASPSSSSTSKAKSTVSSKSRKGIPPPPPLPRGRARRKAAATTTAVSPSAADGMGRTDMAGKTVPFYPSVRGDNGKSNQASAYRAGKRSTTPKH